MSILLSFTTLHTFAQTADSTHHKSVNVNIGLTYVSNLTYGGRYDSSSVPVIAPNITVISKKGFFAGVVGYMDASRYHSGFEGITITPGYAWHINPHWMTLFSVTKYFITTNSPIILNAINATGDVGIYYTSHVINVNVGGEYILGKSTNDILTNVGASKDISWHPGDKSKLKISPSATLYAGTQSFYEKYYTQEVEKKQIIPSGNNSGGGLGGLLPGQNNDSTQNPTTVTYVVTKQQQKKVQQFNILSLDFSLPVNFTVGKWQITAAPHWLLPFNQPGFSGNGEGNTIFYFTVNTAITF